MTPRATSRLKCGSWDGPSADLVTLPFADRTRQRGALRTDGGLAIALDLPGSVVLRSGDGLKLTDGRVVRVRAADEALLEGRGDQTALMRAVWACGACEIAVETAERAIRARPHASVRSIFARAGLRVEPVRAAFDPDLAERPAFRLERSAH